MLNAMLMRRGAAVTAAAAGLVFALSTAANADPMAEMTSYLQKNMPKVSPDLLTAACGEGKLDILYTNVSNLSKYVDEFEKYFPCIEVSAVANGDDDNLARFFAGESRDRRRISSARLPGHARGTSREERHAAAVHADRRRQVSEPRAGLGHLNGSSITGHPLQHRLDQRGRSAAIKTWKDLTHLLDPQFKGKRLGVVDPHGAGGGSYVVAYVLYKEIGSDNVKKILDYLQVTVYPGSGPAVNALASGELDLVIGNEFNAFAASQKGAPVQVL